MSEQWRMPPAQGGLFVKRLAALSSPGLPRTSFLSYCPLLYPLLQCLIRDSYCHAFGGEVIVAIVKDDAGVSFPQQQTATHHHHKEQHTC